MANSPVVRDFTRRECRAAATFFWQGARARPFDPSFSAEGMSSSTKCAVRMNSAGRISRFLLSDRRRRY